MSQGRHRAPKPSTPPRRGLRRLAATLGIAAAAAGGITLTTDLVATQPTDSGWGAPDTHTVIATDDAGSTVDSIVTTVVHPSDSGWG